MPRGWERLASHEGGTVVALATARTRGGATTLFAATATGLFRSEDDGRTWAATGDTPLPLLTAIAPSARFAESGLLFAGTQTGFHRSTDGGHTWRQTLSGARIFAIAVVPGADGFGGIFIGTDADGILRSDDGGQTWAGANPGLLDFTVLDLAFSPDAARDPTGFAATTSGLYRTRNGGKAWRAVELPLDDPAVQCLAISPTFPSDRLVLAGTEGDGLWRSDDGGGTWGAVPGLPAGSIDAIAFSPASHCIAAATADGVALSDDGGETWRLTGAALPPVLALTFTADDAGETLVAGLYRDGVARLAMIEGENRWLPANTGLGARFLTALVISPSFSLDRTLFIAGPEAGVRVSRDGGRTWADAGLADAGVNGLAIAPNAGGGHRIFAATDAGIFRSRDRGTNWEAPVPWAESSTALIAAGMAVDGDAVPVFAATVGGRLIASDDGGERWRPLDFPVGGATVVALACGPEHVRYAGTLRPASPNDAGDVTLWRSTDGGRTWTRWFEERGGGATLPLTVPVAGGPSGETDTIFIGRGSRVSRPRRGAWQTRDGARSPLWSDTVLATGDGESVTVTALAASPTYHADGTVYAATSAGIYRSCDRARTFDRWSENLVPAPVIALATTAAAHEVALAFALSVDGAIWRRVSDA